MAVARRTDADGARALSRMRPTSTSVYRSDGALMALFTSDVRLERIQREHPTVRLQHILVDDLSPTGSSSP